MLLPMVAMAQYPTTDHFSSVGGAGEWTNASGDADMCVEASTILCYNCTGNYNISNTYSWQSPSYGTQFSDDGCTTINITFNITYIVRGGDNVQFWWNDGGWNVVSLSTVLGNIFTGTVTINLPPTTSDFRFDLVTGNGVGNLTGKFVHIDYFTIDCVLPLPIELVSFDCDIIKDDIEISWTSVSETNNSHYYIEHSIDGENWSIITRVIGAGTTNLYTTYNFTHKTPALGVNYYRVTQIDYNGDYEIFSTIVCEKEFSSKVIDYIIYYDLIGQEIRKPLSGSYIKRTFYIDGTIDVKKIYLQKGQ